MMKCRQYAVSCVLDGKLYGNLRCSIYNKVLIIKVIGGEAYDGVETFHDGECYDPATNE